MKGRGSRARGVCAAFAIGTMVTLGSASSTALAHGREPSLGLVAFDPTDREHVVVRATWTLLESYDGGRSWLWRCATAVGYERTLEDPPLVVASDHTVMAGIFDGLVQSRDGGCRYEASADPDVDQLYVIDLIPDPVDARTSWGVTSPGDQPNTIVRSTDDGASWDVVGTPHPTALLERVRVAPSDRTRIYASGVLPRTATTERRVLFFASRDGGETFVETEIPVAEEERNLHVLAVDPTDPDRVLARVVRLVTDEVPERLLLSEDGGATWETAASLLEITGVVFSDDGTQVWAGSWDGGFLRSDAGGAVGSFAPVEGHEGLRVRCLAYRPGTAPGEGELWVCVDDLVLSDYALGRSIDGGETIERLWGFTDARIDTECAMGTPVGDVCPMFWPDVLFDLGLSEAPTCDGGTCDASVDGAIDAGTTTSPPSSCGCRTGAGAPGPVAIVTMFVTAAALARRRLNAPRPRPAR